MKRLLSLAVLVMLGTTPLSAEEIAVRVDGMVCAFCAQGITKKFQAEPAVESVKVDLKTQTVTLQTKKDQALTDEAIKKHINYAGYDLVDIQRR